MNISQKNCTKMDEKKSCKFRKKIVLFGLFLVFGLWCLTPLSTIFQRLYDMSLLLYLFLSMSFMTLWPIKIIAPAYGVYISQLTRYSRACGSYHDLFEKGLLLKKKLLNQWFRVAKLKSWLRKLYGRHHGLVNSNGVSMSQMTTYMFRFS